MNLIQLGYPDRLLSHEPLSMQVGSDHLTEARYVFKAQPTVHQTLSSDCNKCLSDVLLRTGAPGSVAAVPWSHSSLPA